MHWRGLHLDEKAFEQMAQEDEVVFLETEEIESGLGLGQDTGLVLGLGPRGIGVSSSMIGDTGVDNGTSGWLRMKSMSSEMAGDAIGDDSSSGG